jgi:hypothetical protein
LKNDTQNVQNGHEIKLVVLCYRVVRNGFQLTVLSSQK